MFFTNMKTAAMQVGILYIMVLVGFVCSKARIYTEKTAKATTDLLFYIITVCVIIKSFLDMEFNPETATKFLVSLLCNFATFTVGIILTIPMFKKEKHPDNPIYRYSSIYSNAGYMALPLAQAILGSEGVFYCSTGVIAFNVLSFTHGIKLMNKDSNKFSLKKLILNPGSLGIIIGLPLFLLNVDLPVIFSKPIEYLAGMNTPLAMIIFGTYLANTDLKTMFKDKKIYLVSLIRLIIIPVICISAYRLIGITGALLVSCAITAAVPSANNTILFAAKYDRNTATASKVVAVVSFISILTLPVMIALAQSM